MSQDWYKLTKAQLADYILQNRLSPKSKSALLRLLKDDLVNLILETQPGEAKTPKLAESRKAHAHSTIRNTVKSGNLAKIQKILDEGVLSIDDVLYAALPYGNLAVIEFLLQRGASADRVLDDSIVDNNLLLAELALRYNPSQFSKEYALSRAVDNNSPQMVSFLIKNGISPPGYTDLLQKASREGKLEVVQELLALPWNENKINQALLSAIESGHYEIVELILNAGASSKILPLSEAVRFGRTRIAQLLISRGADPNKIMPAAIEGAGINGYVSTIKVLLDSGLDPNKITPGLYTTYAGILLGVKYKLKNLPPAKVEQVSEMLTKMNPYLIRDLSLGVLEYL